MSRHQFHGCAAPARGELHKPGTGHLMQHRVRGAERDTEHVGHGSLRPDHPSAPLLYDPGDLDAVFTGLRARVFNGPLDRGREIGGKPRAAGLNTALNIVLNTLGSGVQCGFRRGSRFRDFRLR